MKTKQAILTLALSGLLVACGSGSSGGSSSGSTPTNSPLPYTYSVPSELKEAVAKAMQSKINWEAPTGYKPFIINSKKIQYWRCSQLFSV